MSKKLFSFRLEESFMEEAKEKAQSERISLTKLVTLAVQEYINKKQAPENDSSGAANAQGAANANTIKSAVSENDVGLVRELLVELLLEHRGLSEIKSQNDQLNQIREDMEKRFKSLEKKIESIPSKDAC